jgi:RNA polymerase sigma-70 factor (ECF subfamily)
MPTNEELGRQPENITDAQQRLRQVAECQDYIYQLCYRFLRHEEEAKDAAQDVFLLAQKSLPRFRGDSSLKTWLYHIAEKHCLNHLRRKPIHSLEDEAFQELPDRQAPVGGTVEDKVFYEQILAAVEQAARDRKPPWDSDDYFIFELYYGNEKLTWPQVAAILGKPVDTVKWHFYNHVLPTLKEVGKAFGTMS